MRDKSKRKGGRPRLSRAEKRQYVKVVKMNTKEFYMLKSKADIAGMTMTEYLRACIDSTNVIQRIRPEEMDYIRKLIGMSTNLNQLAKQANTFGYNSDGKKYSELSGKIAEIITMISNDR